MFENFEKFGHVLNVSEPEPFHKNPFSARSTELEAKEAMALDVEDSDGSFLGVMRQIEGFIEQNRGTLT